MDSDALDTFLTVHRRGGISNAAKALHRSQPAISRRIALLEQELGVPLFERIAGRTMLSDAGRVMVPYAERAVAAAQDAENAVRALAQSNSGPVALAVVGTLAGGRLSAILKRFAAEHPDGRTDPAHGDQRRGQRSDPARRSDDRPALRSRPFARSRLRIAVRRTAAGGLRAGSSARRPPRREACRSARRTLDRFSRGAGTARDHGVACVRAVPDPRPRRGRLDAGRQPDRAEASGRSRARHRAAVGKQRRRGTAASARSRRSASAISRPATSRRR